MNESLVYADFSAVLGPVKDMNSVNNGPYGGNAESYKALGIPFARNHDAAFCSSYGGSHTVDIIAVFPDFDADENDPASYDFTLTDEYISATEAAGTRMFYRLGNKIEHESKKYGAVPPKDYKKWARICEHIIRHETEGWADGFFRDMPYWEIWNEPEVRPMCWTGTDEEFIELYDVAARHLKKCFPKLHIGGPASSEVGSVLSPGVSPFVEKFFTYLTRNPADPTPLDFFSFHRYTHNPLQLEADCRRAREVLDRYGYTEAETFLNEWNYNCGWMNERMLRGYQTIPSLKGAAFVLSCMAVGQNSPVDHLMYYDARANTNWNGLWDLLSAEPQKPYYSFLAFRALAKLGLSCPSECHTPSLYTLAAKNEEETEFAFFATRYEDGESPDGAGEPALWTVLSFSGLPEGTYDMTVSVLDRDHNLTAVAGERISAREGFHAQELPMYATVLVTLRKISQ